jgi:hypothetical protein
MESPDRWTLNRPETSPDNTPEETSANRIQWQDIPVEQENAVDSAETRPIRWQDVDSFFDDDATPIETGHPPHRALVEEHPEWRELLPERVRLINEAIEIITRLDLPQQALIPESPYDNQPGSGRFIHLAYEEVRLRNLRSQEGRIDEDMFIVQERLRQIAEELQVMSFTSSALAGDTLAQRQLAIRANIATRNRQIEEVLRGERAMEDVEPRITGHNRS